MKRIPEQLSKILRISIIPAVVLIYELFGTSRDGLVQWAAEGLEVSTFAVETALLLLLVFVIAFINVLIFWFNDQSKQKEIQEVKAACEDQINDILKIAIDDDMRGKRIEDFQTLRDGARREVLIMGIGMSFVSMDDSVTRLLDQNKTVRLLIMDPDLLLRPGKLPQVEELKRLYENKKWVIDNEMFSDYFQKEDYRGIIEGSLEKIQRLIGERREKRRRTPGLWKGGKIELRKYPYFVPLNVTICDPGQPDARLVAEVCLPFTQQRMRIKASEGKVEDLMEEKIMTLWDQAIFVDSDAPDRRREAAALTQSESEPVP